jgi:hypothetical protein
MEEYKIELAEYLAKAGDKVADAHIDEDMSDVEDVEMAEVGTVDSDVSSEDEDEPAVTAKALPPQRRLPVPTSVKRLPPQLLPTAPLSPPLPPPQKIPPSLFPAARAQHRTPL